MPIEISYLIASAALFFVMIVVQACFSIGTQSVGTLLGARDDMTDRTKYNGRARRANANMVEAMIMFIPLILCAAYLDAFNAMTALGAALFLWGRAAFAPLYWLGVSTLRTAAWAVAIAGLGLIFLQIIPFTGGA